MMGANDFRQIIPQPKKGLYTAEHVSFGIPVPKTSRVEQFAPDQWEEFIEEWASSLKSIYYKVERFAGSGDMGLDVVGFISDNTFKGGWDNYQCKHYNQPLKPSDFWIEIGKIVYYAFKGEFSPPRTYFLVASKGIGTKLGKCLANPETLKDECKNNWAIYCETKISTNVNIKLENDLLNYFEQFDFSIFSSKSLVELIEGHAQTPFHTVRFGGGLPLRPKPDEPPDKIEQKESRYVAQLYEAYSENAGKKIDNVTALEKKPELKKDFLRQRERFYHAESLRNFARDRVPTGTFEDLQDDIYQGVIDVCESNHDDGLARLRATITQSAQLPVTSNPLSAVTKTIDKQGICHQLANDDRLIWVPGNADEKEN